MTVENLSIKVDTNADRAAPKIASLATALEKLQAAAGTLQTSGLASLANAVNSISGAKISVSTFNSLSKGIERLSAAMSTITPEDAQNFNVLASAMAKLNGVDLRGISSSIGAASRSVKKVGDAARSSNKPLGNFLSSLKRIAFYRFIRSIIKSIVQAFTEGLKAAYLFSKSIESEGHRFAAALDELKSATNQMKGQLGSAFISLLAAIQPILLQIIDLVTRAADAIAQFFASFSGTTYLKALRTSADFVDDMKAGGRAAKEWKNQLLGFDEINKLNDNSGGGGGGTDPLAGFDFEDVPINEKTLKIFESIKEACIGIGAAIAGWKIAELLTNFKKINLSSKQLFGIAMAVAGAFLLVDGFIDAIKNGMDWQNLGEMVLGVALAAGGLALAFGSVAAAVALLVGGVALLIAGFADWIRTGELSTESFWAIEAGIAAIGIGIALLVGPGGWIALLIAAVAGIAFAVATHWEQIKEWTKETWDTIKTWTIETWEKIKEKITTVVEDVKTWVSTKWEEIKSFFTESIPKFIESVGEWFSELPEKIGYWLGFAAGKLVAWAEEAIAWAKEEVPKIITSIVEFFEELPSNIWDAIIAFKDTMVEWATAIAEWGDEHIPAAINSIIDWFAKMPNALVNVGKNMITALWNGITSMGSWLVEKVKGFFGGLWDAAGDFFKGLGEGFTAGYESVQRFASGGFPVKGDLFIAGEAGAEIISSNNGQTQVSNTNQIAASVEVGNIGVVQAINALIRAVENKDTSPVVTIGDRDVYRAAQRGQRAVGNSLVTSGA